MEFGILQYLLGAVCAGSLFGIFKMNKQQNVNPKAQSISLVLLLVFIVSCVTLVWSSGMLSAVGVGQSTTDKRISGFRQTRASQIYTFGNAIGADKKVLLVVNEGEKERHESNEETAIASYIDALKSSAVGDNFVLAAPERSRLKGIPTEQREMMTGNVPPGDMTTSSDINKMLDANKGVDAIIFANAFPNSSVSGVKAIRKNASTPVYIAEFSGIHSQTLRDLLKQNAIAGAAVRGSNANNVSSQQTFSNYQDAFNALFEFITN